MTDGAEVGVDCRAAVEIFWILRHQRIVQFRPGPHGVFVRGIVVHGHEVAGDRPEGRLKRGVPAFHGRILRLRLIGHRVRHFGHDLEVALARIAPDHEVEAQYGQQHGEKGTVQNVARHQAAPFHTLSSSPGFSTRSSVCTA
jgi:hypothetical protein